MGRGLVTRRSTHDVGKTVSLLRTEAERVGASVVAVVDHAAAAHTAGLSLPDTQVIIFGNPQAGTPLMQAHPDIAIDLPMRLMVRDDGQPGALVSWQDPAYLAERYGLDADQLVPLNAPAKIASAVDGS
ncbi:DUF302 domain-containing protein [Micromonospora mirobrigensis]|uniref:Uncharacterized conserved protein, DUF302 family n=1 Tax=Micromonospora mirobrigensis TaxID=262898 RepID=A0A1C4YXB2_9ACTN|nr:DUF302 domain-containing protein [Micromonospora mirobrigensis]SCF25340.1 Uncharacterized conserved protein, DUF302 family [Micromonospora mirobrigensis]